MQNMSISFENLPGTSLQNIFCSTDNPYKEGNIYFFYLSKFLSDGIEIKPVTFWNTESLKEGRTILQQGFITGIELNQNEVVLRIFQGFKEKLPKNSDVQLFIVTNDSKIHLGKANKIELLDREQQNDVNALYGKYLQAGARALQEHMSKTEASSNTQPVSQKKVTQKPKSTSITKKIKNIFCRK